MGLLLTRRLAVARLVAPSEPGPSAPVITSNGGGATAEVEIEVGDTAVTTCTATGDLGATPWSLDGGADVALFSIDAATGVLTLDDPAEEGEYEVVVKVTDNGALTDSQTITVTASAPAVVTSIDYLWLDNDGNYPATDDHANFALSSTDPTRRLILLLGLTNADGNAVDPNDIFTDGDSISFDDRAATTTPVLVALSNSNGVGSNGADGWYVASDATFGDLPGLVDYAGDSRFTLAKITNLSDQITTTPVAGTGSTINFTVALDTDVTDDMPTLLQCVNGTITLAQTTGLSFTRGSGADDAAMQFTGTRANKNAALTNATWNATSGPSFAGASIRLLDANGNTTAYAPIQVARLSSTTTQRAWIYTTGSPTGTQMHVADGTPDVLYVPTSSTDLLGNDNNAYVDTFYGVDVEDAAQADGLELVGNFHGTSGVLIVAHAGLDGQTVMLYGTVDSLFRNGELVVGVASWDTSPSWYGDISDPVQTIPAGDYFGHSRDDTPDRLITALAARSGDATAVIAVDEDATISIISTTGLTSSSGNGTAALTLVGPVSAVSEKISTGNNIRIDPVDGSYTGTITITMDATDSLGLTATQQVTHLIVTDTEAPVISVPGAQPGAVVDTPFALGSGTSNAVTIADNGPSDQICSVTLAADAAATITLAAITGLTFSVGTGTADATMAFTGTLANINAALEGMTVNPDSAFTGDVTLTADSTDAASNAAVQKQVVITFS